MSFLNVSTTFITMKLLIPDVFEGIVYWQVIKNTPKTETYNYFDRHDIRASLPLENTL